jgi:hypothetical protein
LKSGSKSSSSSSSHTPSGEDAGDEDSEKTIEYESKRPPEKQAEASDMDDEPAQAAAGTFVF